VRERADTQLAHPALARVHAASGGNPFYALELVRALPADGPAPGTLPLPASLDEIVAARLTGLEDEIVDALLTVAALANPTFEQVERAVGARGLELLEQAEARGVVEFDGARWRFAHPLLSHGVYARASASRRRALHRHLSDVVTDVEERARHLARAGAGADAVEALDAAAREVRARGAPDAAAELLELAIALGGGPELRVRAAEHLSDAGDPRRAQALLADVYEEFPPGQARAEALLLLGELRYHDDSYAEAQELLEWARDEPSADDRVRLMIDLRLGFMLFNVGRFAEASAAAGSALASAERLGDPALLGQALASVTITDFALGRGLDERRLSQALALHDPDVRAPGELRPAHIASFLCRWTGQLPRARMLLDRLAAEQAERGEEHDLAWLGMWRVWTECAAGDLGRAATLADDAVERLLALGTPHGQVLALAIRTVVAAYLGQADDARQAAKEAFVLYEQNPWELSAIWVRSVLGFLELSVGDHDAAAASLTPLGAVATAGFAEPTAADMFFHGDVAEAFVGTGRVDDAEPIVAWLEERGATLGRAWAIAVGARCRGLILAAAGDVEAAEQSLERALAAHEHLPMPIERGRTLLVLGRIRRRLRKRLAAKEALDQALATFESTRSERWADRARDEIERLGLRPGADDDLTPSEERVASLAAAGLTNREVAASLGVSPKTVEAHLARAYRKLDVSSRAELGARMAAGPPPPPPPQRIA
jgi:DNA-binding CsgD family transcriptional regulator/TolA-binding protein